MTRRTLPESIRDDILARIRAGEILADISRATGINTYAIRNVAKGANLVIQTALIGKHGNNTRKKHERRAAVSIAMEPVEQTYEQYIRGAMHGHRWGAGHGS